MAVTDTVVDLGRPFVGDAAQAILTIRSTGRSPVNVAGISTTLSELEIEWPGAPAGQVPPSGTLEVVVRWTPAQSQQLSGTIAIDLDTDDPAQRHQLSQVTGQSRSIPDRDDRNPCTDDFFDRGVEECRHTNTDNACDDSNACTEDDRCQVGVCRGVAKTCDDRNVCTLNLCDPVSGCMFPPDGRVCDDGDPCTKDVCDPSSGCQHPNADDGTACGAFSCAVAHLCVGGACRELDISVSSEGYPCSDGNSCTESDVCHSGLCQPGQPRDTGPNVRQVLPTSGGGIAYVATDGFRYLYVDNERWSHDPGGIRIATWDGATLTAAGALNLNATAPPVTVAPGKFVVPHGRSLALIDATDPLHPAISWDVALGLTSSQPQDATIINMQRMSTGLLLTVIRNHPYGELADYVPLPDATIPPTTVVTLAQGPTLWDVDAVENTALWRMSESVIWQRIDGSGHMLQSVSIPFHAAKRVSVDGTHIAVLSEDDPAVLETYETILPVRQPVPCPGSNAACADLKPGCDGSFAYTRGAYQLCSAASNGCPDGTHCETVYASIGDPICSQGACCDRPFGVCFSSSDVSYRLTGEYPADGVKDILLHEERLFVATDAGIEAWDVGITPTSQQSPLVVDNMPAEGLERATGHILAQGPVALAVKMAGLNGPQRISGPGLGEIAAVVDEATPLNTRRYLVGGPMALGEVEPASALRVGESGQLTFAKWLSPQFATGTSQVRRLQGRVHAAIAESRAPHITGMPPCPSILVESNASPMDARPRNICGLLSGWVAATPHWLWGAESTGAGLYGWSDSSPDDMPSIRLSNTGANNGLRASTSGAELGLLQFFRQAGANIPRLWRLQPDVTPGYEAEYALLEDPSTHPTSVWQYAVDGSVALTVVGLVARLHPLVARNDAFPYVSAPLPSVRVAPDASPQFDERIVGMEHGHAWVTLRHPVGNVSRPELIELAYAADGSSIRVIGSVDLPSLATSVLEDQGIAFVTTATGVIIVDPGCQP